MDKIEEIGYGIIGAKEKLPDNVIGYHINEEITKDASNVINANNQTTTGMATIIPGINAPKLIAHTSIYGDLGGGGGHIPGDTEITLSTNISTQPGDSGHFNTSTITSGGEGWSINGYKAYPLAGSYVITFHIDTHNVNRLLEYFYMYVYRGDGTVIVWRDGNGQKEYNGTTAFVFEPGDELYLIFKFTGGTASSNIDGWARFIRIQ